jgi:hypothetical protein
MEPLAMVGYAALGLLVVGWLVISFSEPSPRREILEWASASVLYLALLMLFVRGVRWALAEDSTAGLAGFGLLCLIFGSGLVISLWNTVRSGRTASKNQASATN